LFGGGHSGEARGVLGKARLEDHLRERDFEHHGLKVPHNVVDAWLKQIFARTNDILWVNGVWGGKSGRRFRFFALLGRLGAFTGERPDAPEQVDASYLLHRE